jgi:hypothetical protein
MCCQSFHYVKKQKVMRCAWKTINRQNAQRRLDDSPELVATSKFAESTLDSGKNGDRYFRTTYPETFFFLTIPRVSPFCASSADNNYIVSSS